MTLQKLSCYFVISLSRYRYFLSGLRNLKVAMSALLSCIFFLVIGATCAYRVNYFYVSAVLSTIPFIPS